tara:strand:+ start:1096 stop:1209 length:114 start_codon:yes stop_codon:yes gene_type:complete
MDEKGRRFAALFRDEWSETGRNPVLLMIQLLWLLVMM